MTVHVSGFRHRLFVWIALFFFGCSYLPAVSLAQQPTATLTTVSGTVLVNGQQQTQGTVLNVGDLLETQVGASAVVTLSDGSTLEIGEQTQVDLAELRQTATQARVSRIKLMWGWVRARLSPGHQEVGSSFDIETPNAVIGVKFSQPDVEVSYNPSQQETIGIAHTVELIALNLLTNEQIVVPVGSSVVIIGLLMKVIAGTSVAAIAAEIDAAEASAATLETTAADTATGTGIGKGTMIAIGVGVAAAAGGVAAVVASSGDDNGGGSDGRIDLSGTWHLTMLGTSNMYRNGEFYGSEPFDDVDGEIPTRVTQTDNTISASWTDDGGTPQRLTGTISENAIHFEWQEVGEPGQWNFDGLIDGYTITGTFSGTNADDEPFMDENGWFGVTTYETSGTFTVTVTP